MSTGVTSHSAWIRPLTLCHASSILFQPSEAWIFGEGERSGRARVDISLMRHVAFCKTQRASNSTGTCISKHAGQIMAACAAISVAFNVKDTGGTKTTPLLESAFLGRSVPIYSRRIDSLVFWRLHIRLMRHEHRQSTGFWLRPLQSIRGRLAR